jgi:hypothetical protein
VVEVIPAGMVTLDGTVAEVELLDRKIASPVEGAAELIVTVPVALAPPATELGLRLSPDTLGGLTVRVDLAYAVPSLTVRATDFEDATPTVIATKVADVLPAATETVDGTATTAEFDAETDRVMPLGPAGPFSTMVPVDEAPPTTVAGLRVSVSEVGGVTVSADDAAIPPTAAEIGARVASSTETVCIVNTALV